MQVQARYRDPIARGEVTVLFRRWRRCQVVAGRTYRTAAGRLEVTSVGEVDPDRITRADARRNGEADADAVRAGFRGDPAHPTYRIGVRAAEGPDPRSLLAHDDDLSDDDVAEIDRRLDRLDRASSHGAWTVETLGLIEASPATLAADLAASVGREPRPVQARRPQAQGPGSDREPRRRVPALPSRPGLPGPHHPPPLRRPRASEATGEGRPQGGRPRRGPGTGRR